MQFEELHNHFRGETQQDPPPFGEGVIEWDYSRYTRALGLGRTPGLDTLKRRACALVGGRESFRARLANSLIPVATDAGWEVAVVNARPSSGPLDAVIYQLAAETSHPGGLLLRGARPGSSSVVDDARIRRQGQSRFRLEERWCIAADRVRRWLRMKISQRGLLIVVEDSHFISPLALSVLCYLLDAQRGWSARMLGRPAMTYVVFGVPARETAWFEQRVRKFSPLIEPFHAREAVGPLPRTRAHLWDSLSVEQEHCLRVLAHAGAGLSSAEVGQLMGRSACAHVELLVSRELVVSTIEFGRTVYRARLDPPEAPLSIAVERSLRSALGRGTDGGHVRPALAVRSRQFGSAEAGVRRSLRLIAGVAGASLLPLAHSRSLIGAWRLLGPQLRRRSVSATLLSAATRARQFEVAREILGEWLTVKWGETEWIEMVETLLSMGGDAAPNVVESGDWARLSAATAETAFTDAIAIGAEFTFSQSRFVSSELIERIEVLEGAVSRIEHLPPSSQTQRRMHGLLHALLSRVRSRLESIDVPVPAWIESKSTSMKLMVHGSPSRLVGYLSGLVALSQVASAGGRELVNGVAVDRSLARDGLASSGSYVDLAGLCFETAQWLARSGLRAMNWGLLDELLLIHRPHSSEVWSRKIRRLVYSSIQSGIRPTGAERLLFGLPDDGAGTAGAWERAVFADAILDGGNASQSAALAMDAAATLAAKGDVHMLARLGMSSFRAPDEFLGSQVRRGLQDARRHGRSAHIQCVEHLIGACDQLRRGDLRGGKIELEAGLAQVSKRRYGVEGMLFDLCMRLRRTAIHASELEARLSRTTRAGEWLWKLLRAPQCARKGGLTLGDALFEPAVLVYLLERAARSDECSRADWAVRVAAAASDVLASQWGWRVESLIGRVRSSAPTFYRKVVEQLGPWLMTPSSDAGVAAAVGAWIDSRVVTALHGTSGKINPHGSSSLLLPVSSLERGAVRCSQTVGRFARVDTALWRYLRSKSISELHSPMLLRFAGTASTSDDWVFYSRVRLQPERARGRAFVRITLLSNDSTVADPSADTRMTDQVVASGRRTVGAAVSPALFVGSSDATKSIRNKVQRAAPSGLPVMLIGPTGTGKELLARVIHAQSARADGPFVAVNCAALSPELLESELFGHVAGAFTGAVVEHSGLVESANGGTLFIDEIDSMPRRMQAVMLRVLESGEYRKVGSASLRRGDFRLLCAGLPSLYERMDAGLFRQDLYYRISTLTISIPSLRHRPEDIRDIAIACARELGATITKAGTTLLESFPWPGNARQLRQAVAGAVSLSGARQIDVDALSVWMKTAGLWTTARDELRPKSPAATARVDTKTAVRAALSGVKIGVKFSATDFANQCGVSKRTSQRLLADLVDEGAVHRAGAGRATTYTRPCVNKLNHH